MRHQEVKELSQNVMAEGRCCPQYTAAGLPPPVQPTILHKAELKLGHSEPDADTEQNGLKEPKVSYPR